MDEVKEPKETSELEESDNADSGVVKPKKSAKKNVDNSWYIADFDEPKGKKVPKKHESSKSQKTKTKNPKRKVTISIVFFIIGLATLAAGVVFLVLGLMRSERKADGEFLISHKSWVLELNDCERSTTNCEESGVIWQFSEIGKGTLTTNNHLNDYDFRWAIEGDKLLIVTDWLEELSNEYHYKLDQGSGKLVLEDGEESYTFVAND